jgi:hypothetical protein
MEKMRILRSSILFLVLLWPFLAYSFALDHKRPPESFVKNFVKLDKVGQWGHIIQGKASATQKDLKELQSLSYLQGYTQAPSMHGVTIYAKNRAWSGYNLFLSAAAPGAVLMDMNGRIVHHWDFPYASLPLQEGYYNPYWCRVRLLKNGSLLALVPFGGLIKLDKSSRLIWFTKILCHHDFDLDDEGNIYTLTVQNSLLPQSAGIKIDSITILSSQGEIKKNISLYGLFKKYSDQKYIRQINSLGHKKTPALGHSPVPGDAFHSNAIQVLDEESHLSAFKKGNLLISLRETGLVICIDPVKEKIVWLMEDIFWSMGLHFAKLLASGNVLIFDNYFRDGLSRVVEFDPGAKKIVWDYTNPGEHFYSSYLGQCYRLPNGNTLIVESTQGRCLEVTPDKKTVWEFYNPHQYKSLIAVIYQMQRIPFNWVVDWLSAR